MTGFGPSLCIVESTNSLSASSQIIRMQVAPNEIHYP